MPTPTPLDDPALRQRDPCSQSSPKPGALFTDLAPTAIALASYFCLADLILITQCTYYNAKNARSSRHRSRRRASRSDAVISSDATEQSPLLGSGQGEAAHGEPNKAVVGDEVTDSRAWLVNTLALLAVWLVGGLGWFVSYKFGAWDVETPPGGGPTPEKPTHQIGSVLGYISAVFYLL